MLPYATEYRENRVALDTNSLADNVDLDDAVASVVPTHGAIVRAEFKAHVGLKLLMSLTYNGKPVPFGALVTSDGSQASSIIGRRSSSFMPGISSSLSSGMGSTNAVMAKPFRSRPFR